MKKHWGELIIFALALLLTAAACAPSATPSPSVEPEVLATKNEDIAGVWLQVLPPSGELGPGEVHAEYLADGSGVGTVISGKFAGTKSNIKFWFEGGLYKTQQPSGDTRIGTYQVYVSKRGGKSVQLRFVAVDDPNVGRKDRLTYKPLTRVEP